MRQLAAYRITQLPNDDSRESSAPDISAAQRIAALAAAYHAPAKDPLAFGWLRQEPGGPIAILVASSEVLLALPSGARARDAGYLGDWLDGLPAWHPVGILSDGLLVEQQRPARHATCLDEVLVGNWTGPFGWLVVAEPVPSGALWALADETVARLHLAEQAADRFPDRALEARQLRERLTELRRGQSTGMWRTNLFAGGATEADAARVAGLCCASLDLANLPYTLVPSREEPATVSTELLATVSAPPRAELPGIRLVQRPDFDVTPDFDTTGIPVGVIRDRSLMPAGMFEVPESSLNRHVFVTGATGAGKSQTIRTLLEHVTVPWLVIEPAKAEYRLMANRTDATVIRIRPGEADAIPAGINPLEPAAGFPLQTHADLVRALFVASFSAEEPFPQVLSAALTRAYVGWDLVLGEPAVPGQQPGYPTLTDLQRAAERVVGEIGYSQRVTDDVLGFVRIRLSSLRHGTTGRFLDGGHPIDFEALLNSNVVLEIEDVGDDRDKAFLMGTVLIRLAEHLRVTGPSDRLRHLTVVEEAHRLLRYRTDGAAAHAVEMFAGMLSELRAYGAGLVVADQIPARLVPDVIKNTAVKIVHRLPAADDRDAVGATMNLTAAQSRYLVTLSPGDAAVFTDGMDRPILVTVPDSTSRERAGVRSTASAGAVAGRRSRTCGPECLASACTLRDMRAAQRVLADTPWLRVWIELSVLAHLTGWPMPVPCFVGLSLTGRVLDCALSHAADAAVGARLPAIGAHVDGGALARHVWVAVRARVSGDGWACQPDESAWLLPELSAGAVWGVDNPSELERALAVGRGDAGFGERLAAVLERFTDCRWPVNYLVPPAALAGPGSLTAGSSHPAEDGTRTRYDPT